MLTFAWNKYKTGMRTSGPDACFTDARLTAKSEPLRVPAPLPYGSA